MFEKKLYSFRDIKGEPNKGISKFIKKFNNEFSENPAHIGIVLRGSRVKGYSTEISDFDLVVLYDSSKLKDKTEKLYFLDTLKEHGIAPMHLDVNPELIRADSSLPVDSMGFGAIVQRIAALTELSSGMKIKEYRDVIKRELEKLTVEDVLMVKERTMELLLDKEKYSVKKMQKRSDLEIDSDKLLADRMKLWKKRYDNIWNS